MQPGKAYDVRVSKIHGKGLFAKRNLAQGEIVGLAVEINDIGITDITKNIGIWVNHSELYENVELSPCSNGWYLRTLKFVPAGTELVANYRNAPLFIKRPEDYGGNFKP